MEKRIGSEVLGRTIRVEVLGDLGMWRGGKETLKTVVRVKVPSCHIPGKPRKK